MAICEYGCNQEAKFVTRFNKHCCSEHHNSCPAIRKRNSNGVKKAHQDGKMTPISATAREKSNCESIANALLSTFCVNSSLSNAVVKHRLITHIGRKEECEWCNLTTVWNGKPIVLHLDHINGINTDNRLENLRFLCPNCHSQTPTYCGKTITGQQKVSDAELLTAISKSTNIRRALLYCGLTAKGLNYIRVRELMQKHNLKF